jgi:hypothetical protein
MLARSTHPRDALKPARWSLSRWSQTGHNQPINQSRTRDYPKKFSGFSEGNLVDAARIELATSALRTQRSPS